MLKAIFRLIVAMLLLAIPATAQETLSPPPVLHFDDGNGAPLSGGKLFTYIAGTTTKQNTFTDSTGSPPNTNPIILNSRGEANVWLNPALTYKFVLSPPTDTDPPTNPIFTVDNITTGTGGAYTGEIVTGTSTIPSNVETVSVFATSANTQTLPLTPVVWERHTIVDSANNAATYHIDINGNGHTVGGYSDFYLVFNRQSVDLQWDGTQWNVE